MFPAKTKVLDGQDWPPLLTSCIQLLPFWSMRFAPQSLPQGKPAQNRIKPPSVPSIGSAKTADPLAALAKHRRSLLQLQEKSRNTLRPRPPSPSPHQPSNVGNHGTTASTPQENTLSPGTGASSLTFLRNKGRMTWLGKSRSGCR
jgi:hypothetical protein